MHSSGQANILLVEDNPGDVRLVEELLADDHSRSFCLMYAGRLNDALPMLAQQAISVIVLDLRLPDCDGLETLVKAQAAAPGIPIVVLSAEEDETLAVRSVQLGAQDFLVKGNINSLLLRRSLCYAIERKRLEEQLQHLAHHDVLTGLANRKLFYDRLKQAIATARRAGGHIALMFMDLSGFKGINDSLGHHVGDLLLRGVAQRLEGCIRASDCVARMGGDEFTVILSDVRGAEDATLIAQKILQAVAEPFLLDSQQVQAYASLGVALYPEDGDNTDTLIRAADAAMYQAKAHTRDGNCFRFFSSRLAAKARGYAETERRLRQAFEGGELVLHYQPAVDIHSSKIVGMEALLRWQHPEQGLLTAARFMDDLERTGMILPVSDWVLQTACAQSKIWQDQGLPALAVSVNVAPRQFRQTGFADKVAETLRQARVNGECLDLEFTEELLRDDEKRSIQVLESLARLGVKLTLDNFGSGSISLKSLMTFPIHAIKIDRSLIQDACGNAGGAAIAKAAIEVAHILRIKSLAEGIETSEQLETVRQIACKDAQGFLYCRPLPLPAITELIRNNHPLHQEALV